MVGILVSDLEFLCMAWRQCSGRNVKRNKTRGVNANKHATRAFTNEHHH